MITSKQVFHYAAAATAGYSVTAPVVEWLLSIARWMASAALLSLILALACLYAWATERHPNSWMLLVYCAGFCSISLLLLMPIGIATRIALRWTNSDENPVDKT